MGDYEFHISTIDSWVFEQYKTVTYKYVSHNLSVSSNYAKQMLFDFMTRNGNKVKSTYFISGLAKSDQTLQIHVVKESRLEDVEKKFETIVSKHLYSVAATELVDSAQLWAADRELPPYAPNSTVDDWTTLHEGSSIKTSFIEKRVKLLKKAPSAPISSLSRASSQLQSGLITRASSTVSENESNQNDAPTAALLRSPSAPKPAAKKSSIMGMFAASAAKSPKVTAPVKTEKDVPPAPIASESALALDSDTKLQGVSENAPSKDTKMDTSAKMEISEPTESGPFSPPKKTTKSPTKKKSPGKKTTSAKKSTSPGKKAGSGGLQKIDMFAKKVVAEPGVVTTSQPVVPQSNAMEVDEPLVDEPHMLGEAMEVSSPVPSVSEPVSSVAAPRSLEDDLLADLEASDGETGNLSKLKKNVEESAAEVFDTDEDPFGATSRSAEHARAKKKEEEKQQKKKEVAEARKKTRLEAKAKKEAEAAQEASENVEGDGDDKKRKRRKRDAGDSGEGEGEEAPVVTEQRRRFDAYFGASGHALASNSGEGIPTTEAITSHQSMPVFKIPTTRTRTIIEMETFVNEKGYTVTHEVERTVEEAISTEEQEKMKEEAETKHKRQQEADQARREAEAKKAAAKATASAKAAAAPPAAKKASITSFFGKK